MRIIKNLVVVCFIIAVTFSCSRTKDTVVSRNYQALTTKFNVLFNGKQALLQGVEEINNEYKDDWFERLPIEPIAFEKEPFEVPPFGNQPKEEEALTPFEKAEDKAVKAIQKHGMNIGGLERNRQIDDAYLLLGKARYYQQRFIPAIEAFNYVIAKYPNANLIAETKIWRAKANIRIENEELAVESMKLLLVIRDTLEAELPDRIKEQGYTALAMAYLKMDSLQRAKEHLHLATRTLKDRAQGARNLFVLGQMYAQENKKDSASLIFRRLADFKKAPYKYKVRANIELAKNVSTDSSTQAVLERLQKLIKDRENRPFLDELYYQTAVLYESYDSIALANTFYNKSLRSNSLGKKQKTYTYERLGNQAFKQSEYLNASAYYDSVMKNAEDTLALRIRRVKRKYNNLAALIAFEKTIINNDSILRIAAMSKEEQEQFFQKVIDNKKKADQEAAQKRLNQLAASSSDGGIISGSTKGGWYFYNSQSLSYGKSEFKRIWGNRRLQDNWRWSSDSEEISTADKENTSSVIAENAEYNIDLYLDAIPTDQEAIDSLKLDRTNALYESGIIYKERFKDYTLAEARLQRALEMDYQDLDLPLNWHLYQLNERQNRFDKANQFKQVILQKYPETQFARMISDKDGMTIQDQDVAEDETAENYKKLYYLYKDAQYKEVIAQVDNFIESIPSSYLLPKFELLKALAIGKSLQKEDYQKALEFVAVNYGNTIEGEKAKEILSKLAK